MDRRKFIKTLASSLILPTIPLFDGCKKGSGRSKQVNNPPQITQLEKKFSNGNVNYRIFAADQDSQDRVESVIQVYNNQIKTTPFIQPYTDSINQINQKDNKLKIYAVDSRGAQGPDYIDTFSVSTREESSEIIKEILSSDPYVVDILENADISITDQDSGLEKMVNVNFLMMIQEPNTSAEEKEPWQAIVNIFDLEDNIVDSVSIANSINMMNIYNQCFIRCPKEYIKQEIQKFSESHYTTFSQP